MKNCEYCGTPLEDNAEFCNECGGKQEKAEVIEETENKSAEEITEEPAEETTEETAEEETAETVNEEDKAEEESTEEKDDEVEDAEALSQSEEIGENADDEDTTDEDDYPLDCEEDDVRVCPHCGNTTVAAGHEYCYMCETALLKTKIPFVAWIAGIAALGLSFFAFIMICLLSAPALQVIKGDIKAADNNWFSAYEEYSNVSEVITELTDIVGDSSFFTPLLKSGCGLENKMFKAVVNVYDPLQAYNYASNVFTTNSKYMTHAKSYKECKVYYDEYEAAYNAISDAMSGIAELESPTVKDGENAIAEMEKARGTDGLRDVWLDYFIYSVAGYCTFDSDTKDGYLEDLHESAQKESKDYAFLYYNDYINMLIRTDRDDEALPLVMELREKDISDWDAANQLFKIYVKAGDMDSAEDLVYDYKENNETTDGADSDSSYSLLIALNRVEGNYDEVKSLAEEANSLYSLIPEFDRQLALVYLLEGDYDNAYESAVSAENKAYTRYSYYGDSSAYTDDLLATVYVSAVFCQKYGKCNTENAANIQDIIDSYEDTETSERTADIVDEKVSLESVLTEGVCDLI